MKFTDVTPNTWIDLQNLTAKYLNEAGYSAITPFSIETVRGKVEVDVYVEAPYELIKKIIIECKFWSTPVPKEKIHAFRTVVHDSGAALGIIISKNGFQSGAIEAAKYSNILLLSWEEFTMLIFDNWLKNRFKKLKIEASPLYLYINTTRFPCEKLIDSEKKAYNSAFNQYYDLRATCFMISISALKNMDRYKPNLFYRSAEFLTFDSYFEFLFKEVARAKKRFEEICFRSQINFSQFDFEHAKEMFLMNLLEFSKTE